MELADEEERLRILQDEALALPDMKIVVSGLAGRFPKADSVNEFEENLFEGRDMINDRDESRFTCGLWGLPPRAGRLKDLSRFDYKFFGFTQEEANYMDFQLRILYEVVYESILDSGLNPASLRGSNTGVFFGLHCNEFENAMADDPNFKTNGYYGQFAIKIAQYFDFKGLTVTFDAACASGFVGLHSAIQAINDNIIEQAIVCSSNIPIHPTGSFIFLQMQMLSPTGYSRFLDSRADGYVKSEAVVSMLVQRKHLARRNYASIMASMTSVDGYKPEGITFPSDKSQEELIRRTKRLAGISLNHVQYLEAHGTGTPAGDPQEAAAIASVYCPKGLQDSAGGEEALDDDGNQERRLIGPLLVGSVKTNMGHSEAASGLCALSKAILMLENELIYKGLHFEQPNTNIGPLVSGRLKFVERTTRLEAKIIPLSCYGFGGSNVHLIVRANERQQIARDSRKRVGEKSFPRLIVMFGRSREALEHFFARLLDGGRNFKNCLSADFLALTDKLSCDKIDRLMEFRGYLLIEGSDLQTASPVEISRKIERCQVDGAKGEWKREMLNELLLAGKQVHIQDCQERRVNLILPGLGCEWPGMAAGLMHFEPFWSTIRRLDQHLESFREDVDLVKLLKENFQETEDNKMTCKFVSIIAYEIALVNLIRDRLKVNNLGKIIGHSLGELACAYAANLFNERETIMVAYRMARTLDLNRKLISGKMVAINVGQAEAEKLIGSQYKTVRISCINGPNSTTLSGSFEEMDSLCADLEEKRKDLLLFQVENSIALHNELIMSDKIKTKLRDSIGKVLFPLADYDRTKTPAWISTIESSDSGEDPLKKQANANYFAECLCRQVNFSQALNEIERDSIVLELGPSGLFRAQMGENLFHLDMMRKNRKGTDQIIYLLEQVGQLYLLGATFDLTNLYHDSGSAQALFPVRRQTPSLSSIFKWLHADQLFVPRYPIQFSKSSAKCEIPVDIVQERDKYLMGHCIEGRVLYPATGYLFLIWRVFSFTKRRVFDACFQSVENELVPVEFLNVRLLRAVLLSQQRSCQIYIQLEEGTGRFEIKEGGSVVCEGFVRTPMENPNGLLYEKTRLKLQSENLNIQLNSEDIYKQFRVNGYDYGQTFQNILESSSDGRFSRIKFNGYFVSLTDSILQTIFLAVSQYAPSGGLFLPTKFDYVRLNPEIILNKLKQFNMPFDLNENSLSTQSKREIMTKLMQRESEVVQSNEPEVAARDQTEESETEAGQCIFETFCDPITGIIITDGIEMRGVKATPAPRRDLSLNEVLLESYQFVRDEESLDEDEIFAKQSKKLNKYIENCSKLLAQREPEARAIEEDSVEAGRILESIIKQANRTNICQLIRERKSKLTREDPIFTSFERSERVLRPMIEIVLENTKSQKNLRVLELNFGDNLLKNSMDTLLANIGPNLNFDYSLAHPNLTTLKEDKLLNENSSFSSCPGSQVKLFEIKGNKLRSLFCDYQFNNLDLLVYKDSSCYWLANQEIDSIPEGGEAGENNLETVIKQSGSILIEHGFLLVSMRWRLTKPEAELLLMSEPKESFESCQGENYLNGLLKSRCDSFVSSAKANNLMLVSRKSDKLGNLMLLFRTGSATKLASLQTNASGNRPAEGRRKLIRIRHDNLESIRGWLESLKGAIGATGEGSDAQIWLCAVASGRQPISGLVGMMRALIKEFGSSRLRCFYDNFTFKDELDDDSISLARIEESANFQLSLSRNLLWNCVDLENKLGSYRHFTINEYLSHEESLCDGQPLATGEQDSPEVSGAYINNAKKGDLSSFTWFECPFRWLGGEEARNLVRVAYSALNFRDVMLSTGRLPLDAIPMRLAQNDCLLGLEFSGFDCGNRRVMGMVFGRGLASHVICPERGSIKIELPDWLSLEEAATIPVVYSTAIMALVYRGRMRRGESILIHAGSGGVGQAAIRLAAHFGLRVFTTVGSQAKRDFLLGEFPGVLDEEHIFSSRDCNFERQILTKTRGLGVDLVLNSLADDKLKASLRCLKDGGRFLEIGKYDMALDNRFDLAELNSNKSFHGILLDKLFDVHDISESFLNQLKCVLETLKEGLKQGFVRPIKHVVFKRNEIEKAFRFMATGKHMGKILIEINAQLESANCRAAAPLPLQRVRMNCVPRFQLDSEKSYIVTGGLGGFGMELIKWLAKQGARRILITSRSGIRTGYQRSTLSRLEANPETEVSFKIVTYDTTTREGVLRLIQEAREFSLNSHNPLGGLFHLAMVLKDCLVENMSEQDFEMVCRPKVNTLQHFDQLTRELHLHPDHFVAFSSITSGKGNAGQANYAYANSCLERICELRRSVHKLPAIAIQWGAIGDVGVAYENLGGNDVSIGGTLPQRIPSCLNTLAKLLCSPFATCLSVVPIKRASGSSGAGPNGKTDLVGAIMHVLGIKDASKVSEQANLGELGLDSLMAVEIRQYIEREFSITLNIQEIRALTIAKIREISENASKTRGQVLSVPANSGTEEAAASSKALGNVEGGTRKNFDNYGSAATNATRAGGELANRAADPLGQEPAGGSPISGVQAMLDRSMVASFVPQLELPKSDYLRLNHKNSDRLKERNSLKQQRRSINFPMNCNSDPGRGSSQNNRPIFFIPPIHGQFEQLEAVCASIKRPCIGLNWTSSLGKARSVRDAARNYLSVLSGTNWVEEFCLAEATNKLAVGDDLKEKIVDLVGYSYGATIAFEMMLILRSGNRRRAFENLKAGRLILLDGSPKQIELGSQYMFNLTRSRNSSMKFGEKVDELIMVFIVAHTKGRNVNLLEIQQLLAQTELESKIAVGSRTLIEILNTKEASSCNSDDLDSGGSGDEDEARLVEVSSAMEAFCRRYQLISDYKLSSSLRADCTLIRAEQLYLQKVGQASKLEEYNEDLGLSSVVQGRVELFVMRGDHESFLSINQREIGQIITKHCNLANH